MGRTGINSMRFSYATARTFRPGLGCGASRIFFGMTTWYFGEMVSVSTSNLTSIKASYDVYGIDQTAELQPAI
jgi:hypothetical protein